MNPDSPAAIRRRLDTDPAGALAAARRLVKADPCSAEAHRLHARALRAAGMDEEGAAAELAAIDASAFDPALQRAARALLDNRIEVAEPLLRESLKANPFDVAAIRMLAEVAGRLGRNRDAEALLRRALELAPAFVAARANLATVLYRQNRTDEALAELDALTGATRDGGPGTETLRAAILGRLGEFDEAIALYEQVLLQPAAAAQPKIWMSYGHALKTVGRQEDAVAAYRRAVALRPAFGEAWWSIANLKTARFLGEDRAAMAGGLDAGDATDEDRFHLHFAAAKAAEDAGEPEVGFEHYRVANALRRAVLPYAPQTTTQAVDRSIARFDAGWFAARAGLGCAQEDPIFVLGLPRSGSTLVEQILSSHPMIEGTMELPEIPALVAELGEGGDWTAALGQQDAPALEALGRRYLDRTRAQRREGKPLFIDKLPNNWLYIGLILTILPGARIVDARRHPLDCGYSNFRQHFARGQAFAYDLADIGHYYRDYLRMMRHWDSVLPGRVVRVVHEDLLADPEGGTRALLDALGLPFDPACLRFHENARAVRTASSEQVRRPINRDGVGAWRAVEDRLAPLIAALGPDVESYAR